MTHCIFKAARVDLECSHHKLVVNVRDDGYANCFDLNITQSINISKCHTVPHKYVQIIM